MIDTSGLVRLEDLADSDLEDADALAGMGEEAQEFLQLHPWCLEVRQGYMWEGWPDALAVFFFEIEPAEEAGEGAWVIVGDVPPACLDGESCPDGAAALAGYIRAMQGWVDQVKAGKSVEGQIPVQYRASRALIPPTREYALRLERRLEFITTCIVPELQPELP